jgi:hypothetical protein
LQSLPFIRVLQIFVLVEGLFLCREFHVHA